MFSIFLWVCLLHSWTNDYSKRMRSTRTKRRRRHRYSNHVGIILSTCWQVPKSTHTLWVIQICSGWKWYPYLQAYLKRRRPMQENDIHQSESDPRLHVYINVLIQKCSSKKNYLLNLNNKNCKRSKTFGTGRPAFEKFFQRTRQSYYWRYRLNFSFYISNTNLTKSSSTDNLSSCCSFNSGLLYKVSSLCKHTSHTYTHTT